MEQTLQTALTVAGMSARALALVKTLMSTPRLTYTKANGDSMTIPLSVESHSQNASADVSESMVICPGDNKKLYQTDSVCPRPWEWSLSGYITGEPVELTNFWMPIKRHRTQLLKDWFSNGRLLSFRDIDKTVYEPVVISEIEISTEPDAQSAVPFTMTLKEIKVISPDDLDKDPAEQTGTPPSGSKDGDTANAGNVAAQDNNTVLMNIGGGTIGNVLGLLGK